jgi:hypothetical protein
MSQNIVLTEMKEIYAVTFRGFFRIYCCAKEKKISPQD